MKLYCLGPAIAILKFRYYVKPSKFEKKLPTFFKNYLVTSNQCAVQWEIFKKVFVTFSKYLNFMWFFNTEIYFQIAGVYQYWLTFIWIWMRIQSGFDPIVRAVFILCRDKKHKELITWSISIYFDSCQEKFNRGTIYFLVLTIYLKFNLNLILL